VKTIIKKAVTILKEEGAARLFDVCRSRIARNLMGNSLSKIFPVMAYYVHSDGERIPLYAGYRDYIKPLHILAHADKDGYELFMRDNAQNYVGIAGLSGALQFLKFMESELRVDIRGKKILDVGCGDGALAYVLAAHGAGEVHGMDVDFAYRQLVPQQHDFLREAVSQLPIMKGRKIEDIERHIHIFEGDIQKPQMEGKYDIIVSLSVLEHICNLQVGMTAMLDILKTGGVMIHQFNPFFSETGGHEFGILDFPWGHVRLSREEIADYLRTYRAWEKEKALIHLDQSFNNPKLTLDEIDKLIENLKMTTLHASESRSFSWKYDASLELILNQCRQNYQSITWHDLSSDKVVRFLKK